MTQPVAEIRVAEPEYVFGWLRQMFSELRLLKKNKIVLELVQGTDRKFIRVTRKG